MDNYTPQELLEYWKKGKTLWAALCEFGNREIWKEYPQNPEIKSAELPSSFSAVLLTTLDQLGKINDTSLKRQAVIGKLQKDLYAKIQQGDLIAVGHKISAELPSAIPLHMWPPKEINLTDSAISGKGFEFVEVRIIAKTNLPKLAAPQKLIAPVITPLPKLAVKDKPVGRPTHRDKIIAAYQWLKKNNQIDYLKYLKSHTEIIQKAVMHLFPEIKTINGMDHEAIRRILMPLFKEDKKSSKSTSKL
ncbi:MAG: hypothetical protein ACKVOE_00025 [Rickettsiales bacterium]